MSATRGYVEHAAIHARDIDWYVHYFGEVFGMEPWRKQEEDGKLKQVWLNGGIQITSSPEFEMSSERGQGITHIGLMVEDVGCAIEASYARGLKPVEDKKDWIRLPDGVLLEIKRGNGTSVADALAIQAR